MCPKFFKAYKLLKELKWYADLHHNLGPIGEEERNFHIELNNFLTDNYSDFMEQSFQNAIKTAENKQKETNE